MINMENFDYANLNSDYSITVGSAVRFSELVSVVGNAGRELSQSPPSIQCHCE